MVLHEAVAKLQLGGGDRAELDSEGERKHGSDGFAVVGEIPGEADDCGRCLRPATLGDFTLVNAKSGWASR